MKWTLRAAALSMFVTALAAGCLFANPSWAEEAGVDFWHVADDQRRIAAAEVKARALERETDSALLRVAVRTEVVQDVADRRMTFEEGARRFAELNRLQPAHLADYMRDRYPARTEEERAARQLISFLRLAGQPGAAIAEEWECVLAERE